MQQCTWPCLCRWTKIFHFSSNPETMQNSHDPHTPNQCWRSLWNKFQPQHWVLWLLILYIMMKSLYVCDYHHQSFFHNTRYRMSHGCHHSANASSSLALPARPCMSCWNESINLSCQLSKVTPLPIWNIESRNRTKMEEEGLNCHCETIKNHEQYSITGSEFRFSRVAFSPLASVGIPNFTQRLPHYFEA